MSAILFSRKTSGVLGYGDHGTTFGANPVCCAGAYSVVNRLTVPFMAQVSQKSTYIIERMFKMKGVKSVSGKGLMLGVELDGKEAKQVVADCIAAGLIVLTAKAKVRLLPPLNITYEEIDRGLAVLESVLAHSGAVVKSKNLGTENEHPFNLIDSPVQ